MSSSKLKKLQASPRGHRKIKRDTPVILKIYAGVVADEATQRVKPEKIKYVRPGLKKYLMRRYTARGADVILQYLDFPWTGTFVDYCNILDRFIAKDINHKRRLGFLMHDQTNDMKIDLADIHESMRNMNSQGMSIDSLKATNNHMRNEIKWWKYPHLSE